MKIPVFIKALARICDKESSRYALGGIECKSDGKIAQLTATDGRILATVHYPDDYGRETDFLAIVPGNQLSTGPAAAYKEGVYLDGQYLRSGKNRGSKVEVEIIDGKFPTYEELFTIHDGADGYTSVCLDPALLRKLCDLSDAMNGSEDTKGITLYVKDGKSCVFGTTTGEDGSIARLAIMPRAADGKYKTPPFPARPGAEPPAAESEGEETPAPPPEFMDDEAVGACVNDEPPALGVLVDSEPLA